MEPRPNPNSGFFTHLEPIRQQVEQKIESPETSFESGKHEREALHEVVGEKLGKEGTILPPTPTQHGQDPPSYEKPELKPQVDELLSIALKSDVDKAIEKAKAGDPAVLDAFHDALTDRLYERLVEEGKLKSIQ